MKEKIEAFKEYLVEEERSENTIDNYLYAVNEYFKRYEELTKPNLIEFKQRLFEEGKAAKTVNNRCVAINQFCRYLGKPELCVKTVKIHRASSVENVITLEEPTAFAMAHAASSALML